MGLTYAHSNQPSFLLYLVDTGMGAVLVQEQEADGRMATRIIAYASITLNVSQSRYCTTNK